MLWLLKPMFNLDLSINKRILTALLIAFSILAIFRYTEFGRFHYLNDKDKNQNFHVGEIFHYYLGSKYFAETGYFDICGCAHIAIQELKKENPDLKLTLYELQNLRKKGEPVPLENIYPLYENRCRNYFTRAKWAQYKQDLLWLVKLVPYDDVWRQILFDAGYNSSPAFALVACKISEILPLASSWRFLGYLDFLLIAIASYAIYRSFGLYPLFGFWIIYGVNPLSSYYWTGGSFLRQLWFCSLTLGLCSLRVNRLGWAGFFFGYASIDRIFPFFFAAGACLPWIVDSIGHKKLRDELKSFGIPFGLTVIGFIALSQLSFGHNVWLDFLKNMKDHNSIFWVPHLGLKKAIVYFEGIGNRNFWWSDGLLRLTEWSKQLDMLLYQRRLAYHLVGALLIIGSAYSHRKASPPLTSMIIGSVCLYVFFLPAGYYYVFLALFPVIYFRDPCFRAGRLALTASFLCILFLLLVQSATNDFIIQYSLFSYGVGGFYLCLILIGIWEEFFVATNKNKITS